MRQHVVVRRLGRAGSYLAAATLARPTQPSIGAPFRPIRLHGHVPFQLVQLHAGSRAQLAQLESAILGQLVRQPDLLNAR